ncbi:uncharacterized protein [Argopecten irradians]|uniref:uncharacterized protein n=1 Tax=Argopecten irradians TaxID=31199 RepID=UPI00371D840F
MTRRELPSLPWQHLAADLLGLLPTGENIFVVVDYYSRWFEVEVTKSTTLEKITQMLDKIFLTPGLPESLQTDNGPQFISEHFEAYCESRTPMEIVEKRGNSVVVESWLDGVQYKRNSTRVKKFESRDNTNPMAESADIYEKSYMTPHSDVDPIPCMPSESEVGSKPIQVYERPTRERSLPKKFDNFIIG